MVKRIYLCLAHMSEAGLEQKYIKEAFDTNWVVPLGPNVNAFEKDLETFVGQDRHVVALASGTAAVHLGLLALGVGRGDEVLVQSFTFCASTHPITYLGATPVLIDSEPDTWNMDPVLLEEAIKDRLAKTGRKPKAIVPVYLYGMPAKMDEIMAIASKYDIPVLEDAAEGFGSKYKGRVCGTFGEFGVLSFNGNKMITTSGGGALVCTTAEERDKVMWYATQAREAYPYYQHEAIGYNYRMSNICAGIGRGQMSIVGDHIRHHRHIAQMYREAFADVKGIEFHDELPGMESNFWLNTILLDENLKVKNEDQAYAEAVHGAVGGAAGLVHEGGSVHTDCEPNRNVEAMRICLDRANVESRPLWKPMHKQPVYCRTIENGELKMENLPCGAVCQTSETSVSYVNGVSESLFQRGLCLPSGPMVTDDEVRMIIDEIKKSIL
jgi:dTDP-4-amino-4,6-dideoxygalactose transaminase